MKQKSKIWKSDLKKLFFNLSKKLKKFKNNSKAKLEQLKPFQPN